MIDPKSGVISVAEDGNLSIEESGELYDMEVKVRIMTILINQHLDVLFEKPLIVLVFLGFM